MSESQTPAKLQAESNYGNLPLSFEPNLGQDDPQVKFLSRSGNRTLWLTDNEAVLGIGRSSPSSSHPTQTAPAVLRMKFVRANVHATLTGEDRQQGIVNYFSGTPDQWRTKIPTYARIRYSNLYPGIDLVFYGNNRQLEYDLVVSPGANPRDIKLAFRGAEGIRIDGDGNLILKTSQGEVIQQKPKIYQRRANMLVPVSGQYVLTGKNEVGFELGVFDPRAAVIIDPVLRYSTFLGGSGIDEGSGIAADSHERPVVAGQTCSPNFPATDDNKPPTNGACAAFVTKLDFTGSHLIFSTFIAESNSNPGLALDSDDNIYLTATTVPSPTHFPITPGAFQTTPGGAADAYVTKLNSRGTALVYSTFLGGSNFETGFAIAVDHEGNAYVTGNTSSTNFPTIRGAFQPHCNLMSDGRCDSAYVTKLNSTGTRADYSTYLGGHATQLGLGIAVDKDGSAFVTGTTSSSDFPTTSASVQPVFAGGSDAFVVKFSPSGSHLIYSTFLGGADTDGGRSIALDAWGNAYVVGSTSSRDFPVKHAFQPQCSPACAVDGFVTKLSPSGSRIIYSTYLGGTDGAALAGLAFGVAVTREGQAHVTGFTQSEQFPTTQDAFQQVFGGFNDIFVTKFSPAGHLIFSSYLGGKDSDLNPAIALDRHENIYLTGSADFQTTIATSTFPVTPGAFQQHPGGRGDAYAAKIVALCPLTPANRTVTICTPRNRHKVESPVNIEAGTTYSTPVKLMQVYLDGNKIYETSLSAIDVNLAIPEGNHHLTVEALDTAGVFFHRSVFVNVRHR